jgi:hypothetical protein
MSIARTSLALTLGTIMAAATLTGCTNSERYIYESSPHLPKTVTLVDTTTGQSIWTYDVPVGKQVIVRFKGPQSTADARGVDEMSWVVTDIGTSAGSSAATDTMNVPPAGARRLDIVLRNQPEAYPPQPPKKPSRNFNLFKTISDSFSPTPAPAPTTAANPAPGSELSTQPSVTDEKPVEVAPDPNAKPIEPAKPETPKVPEGNIPVIVLPDPQQPSPGEPK